MKISKYLHSCLLFEKGRYQFLFDPGVFSFAEGLVQSEQFKDVSAVIITHIHPDHLDRENLKKIIAISGATIYTVAQVAEALKAEGLECVLIPQSKFNIGPFELEPIDVAHELIMDNPLPQLSAFVIDGKVLHPVDSFDPKLLKYQGMELLILR